MNSALNLFALIRKMEEKTMENLLIFTRNKRLEERLQGENGVNGPEN